MPPPSHSLFKQQRRQKLRLLCLLFLSIPLIVEIKSHYYSADDDTSRQRVQILHRSSNDMEQHLQQLSGQDDEARDGNNKKVLPKFLAGEEDAMKYIDGHGKKGGGGRTQSAHRRGWVASSSSSSCLLYTSDAADE